MRGERLLSLDVFRGFDMMMIVGFGEVLVALDCLFGGPGWLTAQFRHPDWFGLTFYDTIYPTFIFIAGISFPFSYAKQIERGDGRGKICLRILRRALALVALGLVYNGILRLNFTDFRYASVLGRIGLTWGLAALLYVFCGRKVRIALCVGLLALYTILLLTVVAPDHPTASPLSLEGNFVGWLDRMIQPGYLYENNLYEPSGIVQSVVSVPTAMLGMFAGEIVRAQALSPNRKTLALVALAVAELVAGLALLGVMPLSKKLWTPTFALCVGAYSTAAFAFFYWVVDVLKWRGWTTFFTVIGMNAITIYLLWHIVEFRAISRFFLSGLASRLPGAWGGVLLTTGTFLCGWLVLLFLYRKKTFVKV